MQTNEDLKLEIAYLREQRHELQHLLGVARANERAAMAFVRICAPADADLIDAALTKLRVEAVGRW